MRSAQLQLRHLRNIIRRRWLLFVLPCALVSGGAVVGALLMEKRFESTTTILVRVDETLSRLSGWEKAAALEDQMRNFNEILFSRTFIRTLIDSIEPRRGFHTAEEEEATISSVRSNIVINRRGSDSFTLGYVDSDPRHAQHAARVLADLFIETKVRFENNRNEATVAYFHQKVEEYREAYEASVQAMLGSLRGTAAEIPSAAPGTPSRFDELERSISATENQIQDLTGVSATLHILPHQLRQEPGLLRVDSTQAVLMRLLRQEVPLAAELRPLLTQHDEALRRYTPNHPDVGHLEEQILATLDRMRSSLDAALEQLQSRLWALEQRRGEAIAGLREKTTRSKMNLETESTYEMNRKIYEDMKGKLEQARLAREIGSRGANQFIILDPPGLPTHPSKPNRVLIAGGGLAVGIFLGLLAMLAAELFDSTIRTPHDVETYQKPIIALLPDVTHE